MVILISALGTLASKCILEELKKYNNNFIIGTDIYPKEYIVSSKQVHVFRQVTAVLEEEKYLDELINICMEYKVNLIYPIIDEEIELLAKNLERVIRTGAIPCVSNLKSINICRNKLLTYEIVNENMPEIAIQTKLLSQFNSSKTYPLFIKPIKGRASIGCFKICSNADLNYYKSKVNCDEYIIQDYIEGRFFSVDIIRDNNKNINVLVKEELLRNKNGAGMVIKTTKNKKLERIASKIVSIIDIKGAANLEFIYDGKNYRLVEVNPRLPAGTQFSCMAGFNLVNAQKDIMLGNEVKFGEFKYNTIYSRRYETYEM
jgi:carbamoyl-phosphate synthase large subunit